MQGMIQILLGVRLSQVLQMEYFRVSIHQIQTILCMKSLNNVGQLVLGTIPSASIGISQEIFHPVSSYFDYLKPGRTWDR